MYRHSDPEKGEQKIFRQNKTELDKDDLLHIGINSVRGHIADGVTTLLGRLLEKEEEVPEELYKLLEYFAVDPVEALRIHVLELLPFLEYKKTGKSWHLFKKVFENAHPSFWPFAYKFLYYQYREHFDKVYLILERIKNEGEKHSAESWGLISAHCVLDDLIKLDSLILQLNELNQENAWHGAIKVFVSNLKTPDLRDKCLKGLSVLIKNESFPIKLFRYVEQVFEQLPVSIDESIRNFLDAYINKISLDAGPHHLGYFFEYLSRISDVSPELCLEIVEKYLINLSAEGTGRIWKGEGLVSAIIQLLRWADTEDEPELIRRIIKIQDRLLELGWPGIEEALSRAERE